MNNVCLVGRLTRDPELRETVNGVSVAAFTIAVDRKFKTDGQPTADFINVVAWRQQAEFICKYFKKGNRIALTGSLQTRSWTDEKGVKRYATEVIADGVEFCERKTAEYDDSLYEIYDPLEED